MALTVDIAHPVPRRGRMTRSRRIREDWAAGVTRAEIPEFSEAPLPVCKVALQGVFAADGKAWVLASVDTSGAAARIPEVEDVLSDRRYATRPRFHGLFGYLHRSPIGGPTGTVAQRGDEKPTPATYELLWLDGARAEAKVKAFVADRFRVWRDRVYLRYERIPFVGETLGPQMPFPEFPRNTQRLGVPLRPVASIPQIQDEEWLEHKAIPPDLVDGDDDILWLANVLPARAEAYLRNADLRRFMPPGLSDEANRILRDLAPVSFAGLTLHNSEPDEILPALGLVRQAAGVLGATYGHMGADKGEPRYAQAGSTWDWLDRHLAEDAIPRVSARIPIDGTDAGSLADLAP